MPPAPDTLKYKTYKPYRRAHMHCLRTHYNTLLRFMQDNFFLTAIHHPNKTFHPPNVIFSNSLV